MVCDMEDAGLQAPPDHSEDQEFGTLDYSPVVARLDLIADRVMAVRTAVQAGYTKDHQEPNFRSMSRPTTALDRERERRARTVLLETDALFLGGGLVLQE